MVRHSEDMFKVHPESMCRDDPAVTAMRNRGYWVCDHHSLPDDVTVPRRHPDTNTGIGLVIPTAPTNASLDEKLNKIISLLESIKRLIR